MKFSFLSLFFYFSSINLIISELNLNKNDLKKLSIKKLKEFLEDRNISCFGCIEKSHYIEMVYENQNLPIIKRTKLEQQTQEKDQKDQQKDQEEVDNKGKNQEETQQQTQTKPKTTHDKENIEEILEQLKKSGFGGAKVYTPDDLKNFNPEDFQNGNDKKKKRRKTSKSEL